MYEGANQKSIFKVWAIGVVSEDKERGTSAIKFFPTEHLSDAEGELDTVEEETFSLDFNGNKETFAIKETNSMIAIWGGMNQPNRQTAPDLRKGETVLIFKVGDSKDWYWDKFLTDSDLRGTEHVTYAWKNTDEFKQEIAYDNSYSLTVSTKDKFIHLHIANNDGEACGYDLRFDSGKGTFQIIDTKKNLIHLDSIKRILDFEINNHFNVRTKHIKFDCETFTENSKTHTVSTKDHTVSTDNDTLNAKKVNHTGASAYDITSPKIGLNGAVTASAGGGSVSMDGGNVKASNDVSSSGVKSLNGHEHPGDGSGPGNTGSPTG